MATERKKVIVAEDMPLLRMFAADILEEAGFEVIEAAHADEALAHLEGHEGRVDLLFTDVHMPGADLNGIGLAFSVRARWPEVALIVTSAGHEPYEGTLPPGVRFVSKPYHPAQLLRHVGHLTAD